jgi:mono/diheme cytochrome c family protein
MQLLKVSRLLAATLLCLGCRARVPTKAETHVVDWTKRYVTVGGKRDINPLPATPANIAAGEQNFVSYCMVCHGLDGQNTGVPFATELSPPVPSLASPQIQVYSDGQLKWIIENGIFPSGMPPSKGDFSDDDMWQMVLYIRHLPKAGSLGSPRVYDGSAQ